MPSTQTEDILENEGLAAATPADAQSGAWEETGKSGPQGTAWYARELLEQIQIAQQRLERLIQEHDQVVDVTVTTAVPMDDLLRVKVMAKAEELYQAPISLVERVDPEILGGIIIDSPSHRYDMSVRAQLASVRRSLIASSEGGA